MVVRFSQPLQRMNIQQLSYFLQVAELGSVTRAACALHIAQPALSRHVRQLEEDFGVTLFQRSDRGVVLTDAGRLLRDRATDLLQHFERVRHELRDKCKEPTGEVILAMPPSMLALVAVPAIAQYRKRYPKVGLRVIDNISGISNAWSMVQLGKADLAIVTDVEPLADLESSVFLCEPLCLIGPRDSGLDRCPEIALEQIAQKPLVMPSRPNSFRLILETVMAKRKLPLNIGLEINSPSFALAAVEAGLGYTTFPFCSAYRLHGEGRVVLAPIPEMQVSWTFIQARDQLLSVAGERLKELLLETIVGQVTSGTWRFATMKQTPLVGRRAASDPPRSSAPAGMLV
jgi:LysR family transcriptional regulator, nitrogen assimilation regulatory protein